MKKHVYSEQDTPQVINERYLEAVKKFVKTELDKVPAEKQLEILIADDATFRIFTDFEIYYRIIFGSQISLLVSLYETNKFFDKDVFASNLYKLIAGVPLPEVASAEEIFFDIAVHLATLFAVLIFFRAEIKEILVGFFSGIKNKKYDDNNFKIGLYIIITTGITGVIGLLIKDFAHSLVSNPKIVSLLLLLTGCILLFSEKFKKENKEIDMKSAIIIAIAQGLAVFPGLSRSGLTISSAIFQGIDRGKAAKFSFLMSIPCSFPSIIAGERFPIR